MDLAAKERLFAEEYSRLFDRLYRYIRVRIRSLHDAEDVVADAMLDAFRTLGNFDPTKGNLEQWLMGVARFKLIAYWKRSLPSLDLSVLDALAENDVAAAQMHVIDATLAWKQVMAKVPTEFHPLFTMRFSMDMTHEEIAEVVGKSPDAVRQTFSRLLRKLRVALAETVTR